MRIFGGGSKSKDSGQPDRRIDYLKKAYGKSLSKEAIEALNKSMFAEEEIRILIVGSWDQAIAVTQDRAIVFKKGVMGGAGGGSKIIAWDLDSVHGVQWEFGRQTGFVALQTTNASVSGNSTWYAGESSPQNASNAIVVGKKERQNAEEATMALQRYLHYRKRGVANHSATV